MANESTNQVQKLESVVGKKSDLPSLISKSSISSRLRSLVVKAFGVPQLIHLYGALGLNKTLTLAVGETLIRALFSDGNYLYAVCGTAPGIVVKIDLNTFTRVSSITFSPGEDTTTTIFSDGVYLYIGCSTDPGIPGKIIKIDISTFTYVSTLTLAAGEDTIDSMFSDGTYLYVGCTTIPGKIVKVSLDTFTSVATLTLAVGENLVDSMFSDGNYLYVGSNTSPGKIIKIDLSSFSTIATLTLPVGNASVSSLFSDGTYLYASLRMNPGRIVKIDLYTFTVIGTIILSAGENSVESLFSDGTYLYAGCQTDPGEIVTIDLSTFTKIVTITLPVGENSVGSLFSDGPYLYIGLILGNPGKIIRRYIIPSNDRHQRKIDLMKDFLTPGDTPGTHDITVANDLAETDVVEISSTTIYGLSMYFDLSPLVTASEGGTITIRMYNKIDETTYREIAKAMFIVGTTTTHSNFEAIRLNHNTKFTIQCSGNVTGTRTINYRYIQQLME